MSTFTGADFYSLDELLSADDVALRDRVRGWVSERFMPLIRQHYAAGTFPTELVPELAKLDAFGATIRGHGCAGRSNLAYGIVMRELERGDTGLRTFASVQGALAMNAINGFGSEEQKQHWLPRMARGEAIGCFGLTESGFGSNPAGMMTTARKTSDGYVLDGEKMWIGLGTIADVAVVWAKLDGIVRGFLVEKGTRGFIAEDITGKLSMRAAIVSKLRFEECCAPETALMPKTEGLKSALQCLNHARYGIAWGAIGSAMACYDEARSYALERIQFGKPIASFQLVQRKLALMLTEITKAQLLAFRLAQLKDEGKATHAQISMAKRNNVEMAIDVARAAREILGAVGILDEHQCMRHACNLESVKTYEGTDDMHLLILGQHITGISAFAE